MTRILEAAVAAADEGGLEGLSMRRLGQALGVDPMALYRHVRDKDDLLDGLRDVVLGDIPVVEPEPDWRAAMRRQTLGAREVMRRHPWAPRLLEDRAQGPSIIAYVDVILGIFHAGGLSTALAHHALHVLGSRVVGFTQDLFEDAGDSGGRSRGLGRVRALDRRDPPARRPARDRGEPRGRPRRLRLGRGVPVRAGSAARRPRAAPRGGPHRPGNRVVAGNTPHGGRAMRFDLYAWESPRDLDAATAASLVESWEAAGGDPAASPFEPSSNTGWFARELAHDSPATELLTDAPRWDANGPTWLQTEPAPPARVVAIRLDPSTTQEALEDILGLAAKYDLVLYDARRGVVIEPLAAMAEHASSTFWPTGAIQAGVAGLAGLAAAAVAFALSIPVVSGIVIVIGGFMAVMSIYTFVHEGRAAMRRRGPSPD